MNAVASAPAGVLDVALQSAETLETLASCWTEFLRPRTEIAG